MDITKIDDRSFSVVQPATVATYNVATVSANIAVLQAKVNECDAQKVEYQKHLAFWQELLNGALVKGCKLEEIVEVKIPVEGEKK